MLVVGFFKPTEEEAEALLVPYSKLFKRTSDFCSRYKTMLAPLRSKILGHKLTTERVLQLL